MHCRATLARVGLGVAALLLAACATQGGSAAPGGAGPQPVSIVIHSLRGLVQWPGEAAYYSDGSPFSVAVNVPARGRLVLAADGALLQQESQAHRAGDVLTFQVRPASSPDTADGQTVQYALVVLAGHPRRQIARTPLPVTFVRQAPRIERLSAPDQVPRGSLFTVNWRARGKRVQLLAKGRPGGERQLFEKTADGFEADLRGARLLEAHRAVTLILRVTGAAGHTAERRLRVRVVAQSADSAPAPAGAAAH